MQAKLVKFKANNVKFQANLIKCQAKLVKCQVKLAKSNLPKVYPLIAKTPSVYSELFLVHRNCSSKRSMLAPSQFLCSDFIVKLLTIDPQLLAKSKPDDS